MAPGATRRMALGEKFYGDSNLGHHLKESGNPPHAA